MSADRGDRVDPVDDADVERRLGDAIGSFTAHVRPDPAVWQRIDRRLDDRARHRASGSASVASSRRPMLVAAAALVIVVLAGAVVVRARSSGDEVQVATASSGAEELAIVAITSDSRLVELGLDGVERREIYRTPDDGSHLVGKVAVSPREGVVYVERARPADTCPGVGYLPGSPMGEIIVVPFGGGEPWVVATLGEDPDVDPTTGRLVYLTPSGDDVCEPGDGLVIGLLDPATQASTRLGLVGTDVVATPPDAVVLPVDLPYAVLDQVRWGSDGASVWALVAYGSGMPLRALVRTGVTLQSSGIAAGEPEVLLSSTFAVKAESSSAGSVSDGLLGVSSFDAMTSPAGGDAFAVVGPGRDATGSLQVSRWTIQPIDGVNTLGFGPLVTFDPAALGTSPLVVGDVDVDVTTGDLLVTAGVSIGAQAVAEPDLSAPTDPVAPTGPDGSTASPGTTVAAVPPVVPGGTLLVAAGGHARVIADGIVSASWVRVVGGELVTPTTTVVGPGTAVPAPAIDGTVDTTPMGTVPPSEAATEAPGAFVVAESERPDDAQAIVDAYRGFFEHGDRSALQGSGVLEPALQAGLETVPGGTEGITVTFTAIRFTGEDAADVAFDLNKDGGLVTASTTGSAVFTDGRWKVSAATMCTLLARVGIRCAA